MAQMKRSSRSSRSYPIAVVELGAFDPSAVQEHSLLRAEAFQDVERARPASRSRHGAEARLDRRTIRLRFPRPVPRLRPRLQPVLTSAQPAGFDANHRQPWSIPAPGRSEGRSRLSRTAQADQTRHQPPELCPITSKTNPPRSCNHPPAAPLIRLGIEKLARAHAGAEHQAHQRPSGGPPRKR